METLYTLAEIAIGMAGFSAIVVVFKRRDTGSWLAEDADRFNGMILHSIAAVFFCMLPAVIAAFSALDTTIWRIGSAALGLQVLIHTLGILTLSSTGTVALFLTGIFGGAVVLLQALNVSGVFFSGEFGPYLLGVLWHLIHAGGLFVALVWARREVIDDP